MELCRRVTTVSTSPGHGLSKTGPIDSGVRSLPLVLVVLAPGLVLSGHHPIAMRGRRSSGALKFPSTQRLLTISVRILQSPPHPTAIGKVPQRLISMEQMDLHNIRFRSSLVHPLLRAKRIEAK